MARFILMLSTLVVLALPGLPAWGQAFPTRTITIVVPYPPGGPTDAAARLVGEHMAARFGQAVVIENVTGGAGNIASGRVARATPDGHTLLLHQLALAANATLFPKLPFSTEKDLTGVGLVNFSPMLLIGRKTLAASSMRELAAWMKATGADVKFAHAGAGTLAHLCAAMLAQAVGAPVSMIPYRGGAPAVTDIMAGHADVYCSSPLTAMEQVKSGIIKGFAVTAKERLAAIPEVPSTAEAGFPDLDIRFWQGIFAPSGTPKPVLDRLNAAIQAALADPKTLKAFADTGMTAFAPAEQTADAANGLLRSEIARWSAVIRANGIEVAQ